MLRKSLFIMSIVSLSLSRFVLADTTTQQDGFWSNGMTATRNILQNVTITVPSSSNLLCPGSITTIQAALHCLSRYQIGDKAIVTIALTKSPDSLYDTINVNHANGDKIDVVGDCSDDPAGMCTIKFKSAVNGITVFGGNKLGKVSNFRLIGTDGGIGIYVLQNSAIDEADNVEISGFDFGAKVDYVSYLNAMQLKVDDNKQYGVQSGAGSSVVVNQSIIEDNGEGGIRAIDASTLYAYDTTSENNGDLDMSVSYNSFFGCDANTKAGTWGSGFGGLFQQSACNVTMLKNLNLDQTHV